jgi:hypothetical protein
MHYRIVTAIWISTEYRNRKLVVRLFISETYMHYEAYSCTYIESAKSTPYEELFETRICTYCITCSNVHMDKSNDCSASTDKKISAPPSHQWCHFVRSLHTDYGSARHLF